MKKLFIEWRYYAKEGKTCTRCTATGINLRRALLELKNDLLTENIEIKFKETVLPKSKIPESNIILIDGIPIEEILPKAYKSENECCSCGDLCGSKTSCRTVNQRGTIYEEIPVSLIKEAIIKKLNF
jgi:hypothetical protein